MAALFTGNNSLSNLKGGSMPRHVTIVLDSGSFLQDIDKDPAELDVGYFQCGKEKSGKDVPDIHAYANGEKIAVQHDKLGQGTVNVIYAKGNDPITGISISDSLKRNLLRKEDLYGKGTAPGYNQRQIECTLHFASGRFRCSKVKDRRFVEVTIADGKPTGKDKHLRPIAHDVLVHFYLADDEQLRLERENGPVLFSTEDAPAGTEHIEIELVANNATAVQFFRDALDLTGRTHCWLPNQGDPTSTGSP